MIGLTLTEILSCYTQVLLGSVVFGILIQFIVFGIIKAFGLVSIINH